MVISSTLLSMVTQASIKTMIPGLLVAVLVLFTGSGCSSVPISGRSQLNLVSEKEVAEMSLKEFERMKAGARISRDRKLNQWVDRVAFDIIEQVDWWDVPLADWEVVVFDNPNQVNAFAMAGGKIGVYTGLLDLVENKDQLAFVIAHEIAHVTSRHVHERLSQEILREAGGNVLGAASIVSGGLTVDSIHSLYGMGSGYASLSFNRDKELEADYVGIILMAKAGYDPAEAPRVVELVDRRATASGVKAPPVWLSSHPSHAQRIQKLYGYQEEARQYYEATKTNNETMDVGKIIGL